MKALVCFATSLLFNINSFAGLITLAEVGPVDSFINSTKISNNKATSLTWAESETDELLQLTRNDDRNGADSIQQWQNISGDIWAREFTVKDYVNPEYFLLKIHPIKTDNQNVKDHQFLFENIGDTNWAVIDLSLMLGVAENSLIDFDQKDFKYIDTYLSVSTTTANPEPEAYVLLGLAVLALISCHHRKQSSMEKFDH